MIGLRAANDSAPGMALVKTVRKGFCDLKYPDTTSHRGNNNTPLVNRTRKTTKSEKHGNILSYD